MIAYAEGMPFLIFYCVADQYHSIHMFLLFCTVTSVIIFIYNNTYLKMIN